MLSLLAMHLFVFFLQQGLACMRDWTILLTVQNAWVR